MEMLKTDVTLDIKKILLEENISQSEISREMSLSQQRINDIINGRGRFVNHKLIEIMEVVGYDIELNFVKRQEKAEGTAANDWPATHEGVYLFVID